MEFGADVVGPAASVAEAMALMVRETPLDAAVLDVNLGSEDVFPVADALRQRGVPFVFATGYGQRIIPVRHAAARRFEKPVDAQILIRFLLASFGSAPQDSGDSAQATRGRCTS